MIAFGPVPSRRLGQSLGINNIPPKTCSYSCIYCQIGRTLNMNVNKQVFYEPKEILEEVKNKVKESKIKDESIDYLAFVPDGEPTLDINLGEEIEILSSLGIKIAVITNSSLLWKKEVRDKLCKADWVSVKIDAINKDIWKKIDRPYKSLKLDRILDGISKFSRAFDGDLVTETMLIKDVNDSEKELEAIADFISGLNHKKSYISIPIRPPTEKWVKPADEQEINTAYQIFKEKEIDVEYLIDYEGNSFAFTKNVEEDLLSITSVHPMRREGVEVFLQKANANWEVIKKLLGENKLIKLQYHGKDFYMKKIRN
ncbi:radical SAM protein [Thermoplasmatales archaeon ex4572_165]|nr:MAG: radical SAM protein [Thermoplasmatales archaeon ex4572_165]